jgi:hypothetical protein
MFTDALSDDFFSGIPSNASTSSQASLIIVIGTLFFEPEKKKGQYK